MSLKHPRATQTSKQTIHLSVGNVIQCGLPYDALASVQLFNVTCARCLRRAAKVSPDAQAQLDWLLSQRKED